MMKDHVRMLLTGGQSEAGADSSVALVKFVGMIVGSVIGGLLCLIVPITVVVFYCRRFVNLVYPRQR